MIALPEEVEGELMNGMWKSKKEPNGATSNESMLSKRLLSECSRREIGAMGEQLAADYLAEHGYKIIQRNWRCKGGGEADIIAQDGDVYVMVEVKTRRMLQADANLMPELAVTAQKQRMYRKMALLYLAFHGQVSMIRFDVIAINLVAEHNASLRHLIGAFSWDENV